jgi:hypothetical protein
MAVLFTFVGAAVNAYAAEKPNPAGTWKLSIEVSGQGYEFTLKLKMDGNKLTGTMAGEDGKETPIQDAKFKDGVLTYAVIHDENGQKIPVKATATISGDTMKGKAAFELDGEAQNVPWEAKRVAPPKANPTGTWKLSIEVNGQTYEFTLKLKLDGNKVTGTMVGEDGKESKLQDAKFKDGVLSYTVIHEQDGQRIPVKATAAISGDTMKGKAAFELDGEAQNLPWEAKRAKD